MTLTNCAFFALFVLLLFIIRYRLEILRPVFHKQRYVKAITLFLVIILTTLIFWDNSNKSFQNDSEDLALSMITAGKYNFEIGDRRFGLGRIVSLENVSYKAAYEVYVNPELYNRMGGEYKSQIGLQGWVFYFMAKYGLPGPAAASRLGCCLLLAVVLSFICYELYKKYGLLFSGVFYAVTITSSWITNFAPNLYWVEFTWFVPMLLGLICMSNLDKRQFLYPLFFLAIVIKCACGYEYITVIMLSSVMFLLVEWICAIKKGKEYKQYSNSLLRAIFMIGIMSLLGFAVVILIHSHMRGAGDILSGLDSIYKGDILRRTFGNAADFPESYARSLNASVVDVLIIYLSYSRAGLLALLLLIATTGIMIYEHIIKRHPLDKDFWFFAASFLTCISWFVLGKSHSYIHRHMNYVLWYMGYIQVGAYIVLKYVIKNSDKVKTMLKQVATIMRTEACRDI